MSIGEKVAQSLGNLHFQNIQLEERNELISKELETLKSDHAKLQANFDDLNTTSAMLLRKVNADNEALKKEVRELRELLDATTDPAVTNVKSVNDNESVATATNQ